ncbi:MAG TPA: hypothetical protein VM076_16910 [Gemmatimonadaceae bacterium]|nr:hypothetical protein [Gemmatimonadaceae bacterium]
MSALRFLFVVASLTALTGCEGGSGVPFSRAAEREPNDSAAVGLRADAERARQDSIVRARPGYVIDSILPVEEEIRRFQATVAKTPKTFAHAANSRAALVAQFVRALERGDTATLRTLVVTKAEFAHFVYPTSPNTRPPYRQSPNLVWLTRAAGTDKALSRLATRFGGKPLGYAGYDCSAPVDQQGENAVWGGCAVRLARTPGGTTRLRLFGPVVARGGRYKFLSLTNGL